MRPGMIIKHNDRQLTGGPPFAWKYSHLLNSTPS